MRKSLWWAEQEDRAAGIRIDWPLPPLLENEKPMWKPLLVTLLVNTQRLSATIVFGGMVSSGAAF